ncbi:MAG: type II secretion system ATPase GspE [Porticoccaceae bacterium]
MSHKIGEILVASGKLAARDLERALSAQGEMGGLLGRVLVRLGLVSETDLVAALGGQLAVPVFDPTHVPTEAVRLDGVSNDFLRTNFILPLAVVDGNRLQVAMAVPQDEFARRGLELASGLSVEPVISTETEISSHLQRLYSEAAARLSEDDAEYSDIADEEFVEHLRDLATEAPVIRLVNKIIFDAIELKASDIHVEPAEAETAIRYRVDGILRKSDAQPPNLGGAIVSRIKLLAHLNIAERRLPQDGRIRLRVKGHEIDLRISTVPTVHGESLVIRILDRDSVRFTLSGMGFSEKNLHIFESLLSRPHGILLVTGPTGSGKTTTLYAALSELDSERLKILTVEDPVEYQLPGISQIQVHTQIDLTFARALRSILRQDPDIIMIGEMRDTETAQVAVQASLTGHLVLSTLHTNNAASAIVRLEDMGVERYLITSTVTGVLAQRLVRTLCPHCKEQTELSAENWLQLGLNKFSSTPKPIYRAVGCAQCNDLGYQGRAAVHELFVLDSKMHQAILDGADAVRLHEIARERGMLTLYEDGLRHVFEGRTTLDEVLRVTQD